LLASLSECLLSPSRSYRNPKNWVVEHASLGGPVHAAKRFLLGTQNYTKKKSRLAALKAV